MKSVNDTVDFGASFQPQTPSHYHNQTMNSVNDMVDFGADVHEEYLFKLGII